MTHWRYDVAPATTDCGGTFVIGADGYFSCVTDYGNYAYRWNAFGPRDFRAFLIELDASYLISKLAPKRMYDGEASVKAIEREIHERSVGGFLDITEVQEERELIATHSNLESEGHFALWAAESQLDEAFRLAVYTHDSDARRFCEMLYPRFVHLLKVDLAFRGQAPDAAPVTQR